MGEIVPIPTTPATDPAFARACSLYENNVGSLTGMMGEVLRDAVTEYGADWIDAAIQEAVKANVRRWSYVEAILDRWKTEGFKAERQAARPAAKRNGNGQRAEKPGYASPAPEDPAELARIAALLED